MEDGTKKPTKKTQHIVELTDEDDNLALHPKKSKHRKQSKKKLASLSSHFWAIFDSFLIPFLVHFHLHFTQKWNSESYMKMFIFDKMEP